MIGQYVFEDVKTVKTLNRYNGRTDLTL